MSESQRNREVLKGFLLGIGLIIVGIPFLQTVVTLLAFIYRPISLISLFLLFGFGVTQLIYIIPAIVIARRKGRRELAKGLIIVAAIAFLLNASCFALFWSGKMGRIGG